VLVNGVQMRNKLRKMSDFCRLWYRQLLTVLDSPHCRWQIWILNCVFRFGVRLVFVQQNYQSDEWILFPPNHVNGERNLARNAYPSCAKPHTGYSRNLRGPTFTFVTHFTHKRKLTTFLNLLEPELFF